MGSFTISGELLSAPQAVSRKDFCCFTWRSFSFVSTCFNIDKLGPKGKAFLSFFCVGCGTATLSLGASSASWFEGCFFLAAGMANPYRGQQDARHATSELRQFQLRWRLLFDAKSYFIAVISRVRYSWTRLIVGVAQFWRSVSQDHLLKVEDTFIRWKCILFNKGWNLSFAEMDGFLMFASRMLAPFDAVDDC